MQSSIMLPKLTETTQTISFSEGDGVCSAEIYATDIVVTTNAGSQNHGSSKVKLKNLVDYNWEPKFYPGQLLATHISGKYLAYSIKAPKAANPGSWNGMVRVVHNPEPGTDRRALIKGMKGEIQDLAFAHLQNQVILACIDDLGNFYIHEIDATDSGLRCTLLAEVNEDTNAGGNNHRVMWCPYIPDDEDPDEEVARLLLTTHAQSARMWNVSAVMALAGGGGGAGAAALLAAGAARAVSEHAAHISAATFSPDGSALATAAHDGSVMFFQVYMDKEGGPRCLHKWQPHAGKPLSCLFFLDDHKHYNADVQFWKFAVTGTDNNATIKIWSCKSWSCIQTITFTPDPTDGVSLGFKVMVDTSAKYMLLSDFKSRSLYVMQMARDSDDTLTYCKNISEFLLPYPVLSFCIADAEEEQVKCDSSSEEAYHQNGSNGDATTPEDFDTDEENGAEWCRVKLRLYIVQPKGLQEGTLVYKHSPVHQSLMPELEELCIEDKPSEGANAAIASSILQQQSQQLKNLLMRSQTQPGSLISQRPESPPALAPQLNLMTPDAFSSPGKREEEDPPLSATPDVAGLSRASTAGVPVEVSVCAEAKLTSGGSSPSREVQEIMSHSDTTYYKEEEEIEIPLAVEPEVVEVDVDAAEEELYNDNDDVFPVESPEPVPARPSSETSWPQISIAQLTEANQRKSSDACAAPPADSAVLARLAALQRSVDQLTGSETSWPQISIAQLTEANQRKSSDACAAPPADSAVLARLAALQRSVDQLTEAMMVTNNEVLSLKKQVEEGKSAIDSAIATNAHWERLSDIGLACGRAAATAAGAGAARALEPLAAALQRDLAATLARTDHTLRDNLRALATSKTMTDKLSTSIAKSLAEMVRENFKEALVNNVAPLMEKGHTQLFRQLTQTYQAGTKELAANTEALARAAAERGASSAAAQLCAALQQHHDALTRHAAQHDARRNSHAALREAARGALEQELSWFREQVRGVVAPRAPSPAASALTQADKQMQMAQIQSLIAAGDYNGAFQLALSAADLALVSRVCRAASPARVARLPPHVLLSLLQQLASDLPRDPALAIRYLEEAIFNLDPANPVIREHLPIVIRDLQKQIVSFLNSNPGHEYFRQYKMLLMATESLVKSSV